MNGDVSEEPWSIIRGSGFLPLGRRHLLQSREQAEFAENLDCVKGMVRDALGQNCQGLGLGLIPQAAGEAISVSAVTDRTGCSYQAGDQHRL